MNFLKNNLKVIIAFVVGVILASSITVYAYSYLASDVKYTDDKSVQDALDDIYGKMSNDTKNITSNGIQTLDKYYKNLSVNVPSTSNYNTGSGVLSDKFTISNLSYRPTFVMVFIAGGQRSDWGQMAYYSENKQKYIQLATSYTTYMDTIPDNRLLIQDNGFTYNNSSYNAWNGANLFWIAAK